MKSNEEVPVGSIFEYNRKFWRVLGRRSVQSYSAGGFRDAYDVINCNVNGKMFSRQTAMLAAFVEHQHTWPSKTDEKVSTDGKQAGIDKRRMRHLEAELKADTEQDFDKKFNRPSMRMMNEVYRVSELFLELSDYIQDRESEIHLDININEMHGSSCALHQAIGYIKGVHGIEPKVKPSAWAASYCADRACW